MKTKKSETFWVKSINWVIRNHKNVYSFRQHVSNTIYERRLMYAKVNSQGNWYRQKYRHCWMQLVPGVRVILAFVSRPGFQTGVKWWQILEKSTATCSFITPSYRYALRHTQQYSQPPCPGRLDLFYYLMSAHRQAFSTVPSSCMNMYTYNIETLSP